MRLYDQRTGEYSDVRPGLRVHVADGAVRALVTADLLRRVAERVTRRPVRVSRSAGVSVPAAPFNVPDFDVADPPADAVQISGSPGHHLHVPEPPGTFSTPSAPGAVGAVGAVGDSGVAGDLGHSDASETSAGSDASGDPVAFRLAVLRLRHRDPATGLDTGRAVDDLSRWRAAMAEWAGSPGRPIDRAYMAEAEAALADDLDSPAALAVLDRLAADPEVPPGAKLETVIHLDMLLALDLVAHIGRA
ncbi:hypothetical protein [Spirillospora sp. NPDC047279]|uniref:hypothetical protein n=1 Tax=Spirillospora sp. NPDC047279 TaxID=3155478 RepID=UPI0033F5D81A